MTDAAPDSTSLGIDLAVDTSAVIALLLREPGCEAIATVSWDRDLS